MVFLLLLLVPVAIAIFMLIFFPKHITLLEFGLQVLAQSFVALISMLMIYSVNTSDQEILNGQIISKERQLTFCSHSYSCNCYTSCSGSGKDRSCRRVCDTCYEHMYDYNWVVNTNVGRRSFHISRVDRQGTREPARFTAVKIGEPASFRSSYENYIKGSPDTLFRHQGLVEKYKEKLPAYPLEVYDYHRLNRVVLLNGAKVDDLDKWNAKLSEVNSRLGPIKQVNIVLVIAKDLSRDYYQALSQHWLGGKKNDVIVVIDVMEGGTLNWVGVMSWTDRQRLKVELRDALLDQGRLNIAMLDTIELEIQKNYVRKEFKDFAYLAGSIQPTGKQFGWALAIGVVISICLSVLFFKIEIDGDPGYRGGRRRF